MTGPPSGVKSLVHAGYFLGLAAAGGTGANAVAAAGFALEIAHGEVGRLGVLPIDRHRPVDDRRDDHDVAGVVDPQLGIGVSDARGADQRWRPLGALAWREVLRDARIQ